MTNLLRTTLKRRHKGIAASVSRPAASNVVKRGRLALKRYFFYSSGIASIALGIAVSVSVLAVSYTGDGIPTSAVVSAEAAAAPLVAQFAQVSSGETELETVLSELGSVPQPTPSDDRLQPINVPGPPRAPLVSPNIRVNSVLTNVNVTFYDCINDGFCGAMYNGEKVYEGAAACSWNLPIGTGFYIVGDPTGRVYICKDRGLLEDTWVDIFWNNPVDGYYWQSKVGRFGTIVLVSMPE